MARWLSSKPTSDGNSKSMLSWHCLGTADNVVCVDLVFGFMGLLTGGTDTGRASPKTEIEQEALEFYQRLNGGPGCTQFHAGTRTLVQHPAGHDDDHAGHHFNMDDVHVSPALAVLPPHTTTVQRMPAIKDLNLLPDMGRMTAQWRSDARTGCLLGANAAARPAPWSPA